MKFRNPYGEDRVVPALGTVVEKDAEVDVSDDVAPQFLEAGWVEVTPKKKD